ncbi:MAG TPA: class I SAM-dependent methyltransferase, partial [Longimicrobiales bacterium]
ACGNKQMRKFLSLGPQPLANSFLKDASEFEGEASFPLDVYYCPGCSLVQLLDVIDPQVLFRNYIYVTGTSTTIAEHNIRYAQTVVDVLSLTTSDLVVEVASNDGSLLKCFQPHGVRTLGIEPATNIAQLARAAGVETVNEFFDRETARNVRDTHGSAKAIIANNVLAHVDDTQDFLAGARDLLTHDGLLIVEVPYVGELLERFEYDTVYHEHLCYFSITALMHLCAAVGLSVVRIDHVPVHGGSVRMYAGRTEYHGGHSAAVQDLAARETRQGVTAFSRYLRLAEDVQQNRRALRALLSELKAQGKRIAGYGAPAKGNTLLNFCDISTDLVDFTVDRNPLKVGSFTPGMHIPVLPVEALLEQQPDYVLILAWNFADEIQQQQAEYKRRGGRFILPIPEPMVLP